MAKLLEPYAADNAFHGVILMSYAWMREDAEAFLRVARLAAGAETYDSLPSFGYRSMVERYRSVPMPAAPEGDAFFPEIDGAAWRLASSIEHAAADDAPAYAFEVWERR